MGGLPGVQGGRSGQRARCTGALANVLAALGSIIPIKCPPQGIGDKSALQILQAHGNLEQVFANVDDQALPKRARSALQGPGAEAAARLSKRLVQLQVGLQVPQLQFEVDELAIRRPKQGCAQTACRMLEQWDVHALVPTVTNLFG